MKLPKHYRAVQILLTIGSFEFFGPIFKDTGTSHLMNPEWVGHARIHLAWLLGFMFFSGIANLYLIWIRKPLIKDNLKVVALWQGMQLLGFWSALALSPLYKGSLIDPRYHSHILGIEENAFVFTLLTIVLILAIYLLRKEEFKN